MTPSDTPARATYQSYLLRVWSGSGRERRWYATIDRIGEGDRLCFTSPEALVAFLQDEERSLPPRLDTTERIF